MIRLAMLGMVALAMAGCTTAATPQRATPQVVQESRVPVTILISIDGFRPDYLARGVTPHLSKLAAEGVTGPMRPSFPSKTFPNHYTLVTGFRPDRHGIVGNKMEDARLPGQKFTTASDDPLWWNEAEPIWVTAHKAGIRAATMFWPGSNVAFGGVRPDPAYSDVTGGVRPDDWQQFNKAVTNVQRVEAVLDWLRRQPAIRPRLVTLYFDSVDDAGHDFGPNDSRTEAAVAEADARIGDLVHGLDALGQPANIIIVADHGMAATNDDRVITLDTIADPADYNVVEDGPYAGLAAVTGHEAALERRLLAKREHMACWRKADLPARFAYGRNPRVPPYICLADVGWLIMATAPKKAVSPGNHGYDNAAPDMAALFIAHGPAFVTGRTILAFDNVDVQPMLTQLLGLPLGKTDGTLETWRRVRR